MGRLAVVIAAAALLIAAGAPAPERQDRGNGPDRWRSPISGDEYRVRKLDPHGYQITGRGGRYSSFQEVIDAEIQASGLAPDLFKADSELRTAFINGARGPRHVIVVLDAQPMADEAPVIWNRYTPELERMAAELRAERDPRRRKERAAELKTRRDAARDDILGAALPALRESQGAAIAALGRAGALRATPLTRTLNTLRAEISIERLDRITALAEVARLAADRFMEPTLEKSVPSTRIQEYRFNQIDGGSSVVAVLDTGIDLFHPALAHPDHQNHIDFTEAQTDLCFGDNANTPDDLVGHGTHIAGIIRSVGGSDLFQNHIGMAPAARLINLKSGFRTSETTDCLELHPDGATMIYSDGMANMDWAANDASPKADVVSFSWGSLSESPGFEYAAMALFLDSLSTVNQVFVAISAGNKGPGVLSINDEAAAYNVVAVASMNDHDTTSLGDDTLSQTSSRGPTKDLRFKPDLAAPGVEIVSTNNFWEGSADDFISKSGTSMAAPHVAGAAALALDAGLLSPMQLKATLMNAASHTVFGDSGPRNVEIGQGYMDLLLHYLWYVDSDFYASGTVSETAPKFFHVSAPIAAFFDRFTLYWEHGTGWGNADDLDLEVWSQTTGTKLASSAGTVDNVEFLLGQSFNQAFDNVFKVEAHALNPGITDVPFALASSHHITPRTPPNLSIASINLPSQITVNTFYTVTVTVQNTGGLRARSVTLQSQVSPGMMMSPSGPQTITSIAAGGTGSRSYQVKGGIPACGTAQFQVIGYSQSYGESYLIPTQTANTVVGCP